MAGHYKNYIVHLHIGASSLPLPLEERIGVLSPKLRAPAFGGFSCNDHEISSPSSPLSALVAIRNRFAGLPDTRGFRVKAETSQLDGREALVLDYSHARWDSGMRDASRDARSTSSRP